MPRWACLLVIGAILAMMQFVLPDPVEAAIWHLLHRPDTSLYTGLESFIKASLFIWKASGIGLFAAGIVDLLVGRRHNRIG